MRRSIAGFLAIATIVTGCTGFPESIDFHVNNQEDLNSRYTTCAGGLEGRIGAGSLQIQSPKVVMGDEFAKTELWPKDVSEGTNAVVEATCYDAQGQETGYSRLEGTLHRAQANGIYISGALTGLKNYPTECLPTTVTRGNPPCINSPLLE